VARGQGRWLAAVEDKSIRARPLQGPTVRARMPVAAVPMVVQGGDRVAAAPGTDGASADSCGRGPDGRPGRGSGRGRSGDRWCERGCSWPWSSSEVAAVPTVVHGGDQGSRSLSYREGIGAWSLSSTKGIAQGTRADTIGKGEGIALAPALS
jgi:hypothetical protein